MRFKVCLKEEEKNLESYESVTSSLLPKGDKHLDTSVPSRECGVLNVWSGTMEKP